MDKLEVTSETTLHVFSKTLFAYTVVDDGLHKVHMVKPIRGSLFCLKHTSENTLSPQFPQKIPIITIQVTI